MRFDDTAGAVWVLGCVGGTVTSSGREEKLQLLYSYNSKHITFAVISILLGKSDRRKIVSLSNCYWQLFFVTRAADANESEPCPAFLVPSVPNWPLRLFAASFWATPESVGPRTFLQVDTASSPITSIAITGPELTNCSKLLFCWRRQLALVTFCYDWTCG